MIFFTTQKSTSLRIHGVDKSFTAAPPQVAGENSIDATNIYADTVGSFSNIKKLLSKHNVSVQVVPEEAVRRLPRFPHELGVSNFGEANPKRSPLHWLERDKFTLPQQLRCLSQDKSPRLALLNGLGAALGDTLIGLTAMRIAQRIIRAEHGEVTLDALLRMDLHYRLVNMYAQANIFNTIQTLPVAVHQLLAYRAFFDFSGFVLPRAAGTATGLATTRAFESQSSVVVVSSQNQHADSGYSVFASSCDPELSPCSYGLSYCFCCAGGFCASAL